MRLRYFAGCCLLAGLGISHPGRAQAPAADSAAAHPLLRPWLVRGGLRVTHLSCSSNSTSWRVLLPLSLAVEHRLGGRISLYAQLDTDVQLSSLTARRRRSALGTDASLPVTTLGAGSRYYYGRPAGGAVAQPSAPEFGRYLALEAGVAATLPAGRAAASGRSAAVSSRLLAPSLYALWGIQNRLRPHLLYDLNAGLGVLAPVRTTTDQHLPRHGWDVGVQANARLYWGN